MLYAQIPTANKKQFTRQKV